MTYFTVVSHLFIALHTDSLHLTHPKQNKFITTNGNFISHLGFLPLWENFYKSFIYNHTRLHTQTITHTDIANKNKCYIRKELDIMLVLTHFFN